MEEAPILQIKVLKGPRNGEILVCHPESTIHVGRVMRGNNLALRDPGISQKHLRFQFIQDDFRWVVSDLDTSNGTKLNGSLIQASALVPVSDGDVFAIGEKTELGVKVVSRMVLEEEGDGMNVVGRRVTRRGGSSGVNVKDSLSRVSGADVLKEAQSKVPAPIRGRKKNVSEEAVCQKGAGRGKRDVVMRNDARVVEKEESRDSVLVSYSETEEQDQNGDAKVRRNPRRGKSSKVLKEIDGNCVVDAVLGVKEGDMKKNGKGKRSTKSTGLEVDKENDDVLVLKLDIKSSDPDQVAIPDARKGKKKTRSSVGSSMVLVEEEEREEDAGMEKVGVEEEERNSEEGRADFEKMTLDEWFDSMEIFLPKVINDEAEKIIDIVKEKARKFDELLEQTDAGVFSHI